MRCRADDSLAGLETAKRGRIYKRKREEFMKKIRLICLMFIALVSVSVQAQGSDIVEKWRCFDGKYTVSENSTVLVELSGRIATGETVGSGQIWVGGVVWDAVFKIAGFNRRWNFGEELKYSFIIEPDGSGGYFDFKGREFERVLPSQTYNCVSP